MRICEIPACDVRLGKNWKFSKPLSPETLELPITDWGPIVECDDFRTDDTIVYSGLVVLANGQVLPTTIIKEVGDLDYGGEICIYYRGMWEVLAPQLQLGSIREEYFANPLELDPSFDSDDGDYREDHRSGFLEYCSGLMSDTNC